MDAYKASFGKWVKRALGGSDSKFATGASGDAEKAANIAWLIALFVVWSCRLYLRNMFLPQALRSISSQRYRETSLEERCCYTFTRSF